MYEMADVSSGEWSPSLTSYKRQAKGDKLGVALNGGALISEYRTVSPNFHGMSTSSNGITGSGSLGSLDRAGAMWGMWCGRGSQEAGGG